MGTGKTWFQIVQNGRTEGLDEPPTMRTEASAVVGIGMKAGDLHLRVGSGRGGSGSSGVEANWEQNLALDGA
jgi:hypothetical protein